VVRRTGTQKLRRARSIEISPPGQGNSTACVRDCTALIAKRVNSSCIATTTIESRRRRAVSPTVHTVNPCWCVCVCVQYTQTHGWRATTTATSLCCALGSDSHPRRREHKLFARARARNSIVFLLSVCVVCVCVECVCGVCCNPHHHHHHWINLRECLSAASVQQTAIERVAARTHFHTWRHRTVEIPTMTRLVVVVVVVVVQ
jgi:hypothetical protein